MEGSGTTCSGLSCATSCFSKAAYVEGLRIVEATKAMGCRPLASLRHSSWRRTRTNAPGNETQTKATKSSARAKLQQRKDAEELRTGEDQLVEKKRRKPSSEADMSIARRLSQEEAKQRR